MALNILTFHTHESYQYELSKTGHNFFNMKSQERPTGWNHKVRPKPKNIFEIEEDGINIKDFDILLTQSQGQNLKFRGNNSIKKINIEHTYPMFDNLKIDVDADIKVYISESSKKMWRDNAGTVIRHGIDYKEWPSCNYSNNSILTTVHAFKDRDWACGYDLYNESTSGLPNKIYGSNNENIGEIETESYDDLKKLKSTHSIYFNTSLRSPVPFALLEAMASGMIVVSTQTCEIPFYIKDRENGFFAKKSNHFNIILSDILKNKNKYIHIGKNARNSIKSTASIDLFLNKWNKTFKDVLK
jgi:glycosyltransferase involved in cell wall biosynthesis